ncbi:hypothetical protein GNY06_11200 [Elizabethkingia argentiflava]|uniref:DUF4149 domain-containing protein n=1 Tax=Elizabethkingia argenteiflava TaxID=2681556 RepID=A0A845PZP7_9FLAO|nr:hypothetical protein [Elizabethkingia argenteiflava]NAW51907.1 hypothetical protein [Elizabethkingia argenteiflava]
MKIGVRYPFVYAALFFWLGVLLSISFLEAPLKFQVEGMTLPVAVKLGKLMFNVSTYIQMGLAIGIGLNFMFLKKELTKSLLCIYGLLVLLLCLQKFWMLPILNDQVDWVDHHKTFESGSLHTYFIYAEVIKCILILMCIILQIKRIKPEVI